MNYLIALNLITVLLFSSPFSVVKSEKTSVTVEISNLRNNKGTVALGVYKDNETFKKEKEYLLKVFPKTKTTDDGVLHVELPLTPDTYGIAFLDDENDNGEMDYGWVLPKEGFGFSNYEHSGMSMPNFDDFKFEVGNSPTKVYIKVKYM
ncbi:hypothetical protein Oweho_0658 [Owenweeksia hongkongensis DSM 17368]|uniref:DUF2141 domain-containing protein n=1 Tax=Owenweeksia hongkongensis (strain DSM 17368 / CIP 108786 / JCM 12287 / NRRL B-23963 / UST20020801) TaxID=926562 RepID=G8R101_OWEHD|nr:DUF2141 domain-containing protein [Owenweeksia hongkongensis]AEV31672.1 hypothetical protein Oweho_0658 [Owenweeksia hongkongensis DSM 17368]